MDEQKLSKDDKRELIKDLHEELIKLEWSDFQMIQLNLEIKDSELVHNNTQKDRAVDLIKIQEQKKGLIDLHKLLKGKGYTNLESLLNREEEEEKEWKKADRENIYIMRKLLNLNSNEYMSLDHLGRFRCYDLCMINDLWMKYSKNENGLSQYGFSVQKDIFEQVRGKKTDFDDDAWETFGTKVGWYNNKEWLDDNTYNNGWKKPPKGYFPLDGSVSGEDWKTDCKEYFCKFMSRYGRCNCK
jgi:GUN4-like